MESLLSIHKDSEVLPKSRGPWSVPSHCIEGKLENKDDEGSGCSHIVVILVLGGQRWESQQQERPGGNLSLVPSLALPCLNFPVTPHLDSGSSLPSL